jgi:Acetyltransferases
MEDMHEPVRIFNVDEFIYPKVRRNLIRLYLHAFTTGEYAQYMASQTVESTLDEWVRRGWGKMGFIGDRLVSALLCFPLSYDKDFPSDEVLEVPVEKTIYIAELMVHADYRRKGIALKMMNDFLASVPKTFTHAVIRVWEKNKPALLLYEKLGFYPIAAVSQTKFLSPEEKVEMKKIYLHKTLTPEKEQKG